MRGELCIGAASLLSLVSMLLMIFAHVGQINTSTVPRKISFVNVNTSQYGAALEEALYDPFSNIYTNNASAPRGQRAGLRQLYKFGLYSDCAYVNETAGLCSNQTIGRSFHPYDVITADMGANFSILTANLFDGYGHTAFRDSGYLGQSTKAAYWMLLLGTICAALSLLTGILKNNLTFFVSAIFSVVGSLMLLIGAAIWTVVIHKVEGVNKLYINNTATNPPLGIVASTGEGLYITWAAFVLLAVSIVPYMISCCTYRG